MFPPVISRKCTKILCKIHLEISSGQVRVGFLQKLSLDNHTLSCQTFPECPLNIGRASFLQLELSCSQLSFLSAIIYQDVGTGGVELKGGSGHDPNRHNRRNCQNRHGRLFELYFVGQANERKVLSRTSKTVKTAKTVMKATPLKLNPPFPAS